MHPPPFRLFKLHNMRDIRINLCKMPYVKLYFGAQKLGNNLTQEDDFLIVFSDTVYAI